MTCGAKTRTGGQCKRPAGAGTSHVGAGRCKHHGGASPNGELHGNLILARQEAAVMGRPLALDAHDAIVQCIQIAAGEVQYASDRIAGLGADEVVVIDRTVKTRPLSHGKDGESSTSTVKEVTVSTDARLHVWIEVRHRAMDRLVAYSAAALKAGVEERQVRVAEQTGQLLAQAVRGILEDLGVADHEEAPRVVHKHLKLLAPPAA